MTPKEKFKQLTNLDYNAANIIRLNSDHPSVLEDNVIALL